MEPGCGSAAAELRSLRGGRDPPNESVWEEGENNEDWENGKMPPKQITNDGNLIWAPQGKRELCYLRDYKVNLNSQIPARTGMCLAFRNSWNGVLTPSECLDSHGGLPPSTSVFPGSDP